MIKVILATHGPLAEAMIACARMVYGELDHVFPVILSETKGIDSFRQEFAALLHKVSINADGVLILCDLQSGTPWNVACQYAFDPASQPPLAVVAGANFPMLLLSDDLKELKDVNLAAARLLEQAKATMVRASLPDFTQSDEF